MKIIVLLAALATFVGSTGQEEGKNESLSEMKDMLHIEGGSFQMGDVFEEGVMFAAPIHEVTLSSYYLDRYEVTVEEFTVFVEETGYATSAESKEQAADECGKESCKGGDGKGDPLLATRGAHVLEPQKAPRWESKACWRNPLYEQSRRDPVTCVSWEDAAHYCNWLSAREGLPKAYDIEKGEWLDAKGNPTKDVTQTKGYRLPTEAEWEFAARERGKKIRFGNGKNVARSDEMNFDAAGKEEPYSEKGECRGKTVPVGSFKPNALGLYDMAGNLWEWCSDYLCAYKKESQKNPYQTEGLLAGSRRVARDGPWVGGSSLARAAARYGWVANDRCNNIGFRLARSD
ncbi:MAG: SUMF1/EgtB/PvdO family nonheme iron enzyme [Planctomycetota bacterium]